MGSEMCIRDRYIGHPRAVRFSTCGFVDKANIQESFNFQTNYDVMVFVFVFHGGGLGRKGWDPDKYLQQDGYYGVGNVFQPNSNSLSVV